MTAHVVVTITDSTGTTVSHSFEGPLDATAKHPLGRLRSQIAWRLKDLVVAAATSAPHTDELAALRERHEARP